MSKSTISTFELFQMTPDAIRQARVTLAEMWGLPKPVPAATLGRIIGLTTKNPGQRVLDWERGETISGPACFAIQALLDGYKPKDLGDHFS